MLRHISLGTMYNLRDLGGYPTVDGGQTAWGRFFRGDTPLGLSEAEIQWLLDRRVTTIIDLRSAAEAGMYPNQLADRPGFRYHHCPLLGGEITEATEDEVGRGYFRTLDRRESVREILRLILAAPEGVLFHCMAGKDRTGMISMLLFTLAGADRLEILADYQLSEIYLTEMVRRLTALRPDMPAYAGRSKREYMETCMDLLEAKYGSIYDYLLATGLTRKELEALRTRLLA